MKFFECLFNRLSCEEITLLFREVSGDDKVKSQAAVRWKEADGGDCVSLVASYTCRAIRHVSRRTAAVRDGPNRGGVIGSLLPRHIILFLVRSTALAVYLTYITFNFISSFFRDTNDSLILEEIAFLSLGIYGKHLIGIFYLKVDKTSFYLLVFTPSLSAYHNKKVFFLRKL